MICSVCSTTNDPGARFCENCGARLGSVCANCGATIKAGARFCAACGTPVSAQSAGAVEAAAPRPSPAPPPIAERRLVTVLFADLVGFTPFSEERDAEEVRDTLSRYFELAKELVGRYGGTIEKFIGDAVMAVWGTPPTHEDDAERAVRATLELVAAVPGVAPGIQARAGLLTGEAVVNIGATDQGMVAGDLVNTASRLQSVAPPGAVLVGEATYRAASKAIAFEPAGEQLVKGKVAPVPAWRALRVVAELGGRNRAETLEAPFVGRDAQLRLLKDMLHETTRERRARLMSITGIAGIGKSRLAWEFEKYLDGLVENVYWHHGRSPAYGEGVTFWALGEMVRARAGLAETDDQETTRAKLAATVREWIADEAERRRIEAALLALLGAGEPPAGGRDALFAAWRTFFERIAARDTVVMVFEDLHWADQGMLDFIDELLEWSRDLPIYVVTLARPELLDRRADWGAGKRNFTAVSLEPLSAQDMRLLLVGLVPGLPSAITDGIIRRADGVPLYAIEFVRVLVAEGKLVEADGAYRPAAELGEIAVPETLHALIASRLDALEPGERSLLQDAAVLGQSFTLTSLESVLTTAGAELEPRLRALTRKEVLTYKVDPRSPERGQYSFVQSLIREVAYGMLTRPERKTRHLAAARWLEALGDDELAGALAAHYLAAYSSSPAGPEADALAAQARIALRAAGDRAALLGSHEQALTFYDQALTVSPNQLERSEVLLRAAEVASLASRHDDAENRARQALELELEHGDWRAVANATAALGRVQLNGYRIDQALAVLEPAEAKLAQHGDDPAVVALGGQLARAYFFNEQNKRAVEVSDRVLAAAEHADLIRIVADTLITKGSALANLGRFYEGVGTVRTGQLVAEANGLTDLVVRATVNRISFEVSMDPRAAFMTASDGLALMARLGWPALPTLVSNFGAAALRMGEWDVALAELEKSLERTLEPIDWLQLAGLRAVLLLLRGEAPRELVAELEEVAGQIPSPVAEQSLLEVQCWAATTAGRLDEAYDLWLRYASLSALNAPDALTSAGRVALWQRDAPRTQAALVLLDATGVHGAAVDLQRRALRAGLLALGGGQPQALATFDHVWREFRDRGLVLDEAFSAIDALTVFGSAEPAVREAAQIAHAKLVALRAQPLVARLEQLLELNEKEQSSAVPEEATEQVARQLA